ncbi:MAG: A24 family peptidase, partial [Acidimicrobiales bacterium]
PLPHLRPHLVQAAVVAGSAVLGLLVGSVLNVLIDRVPSKAPLRGPRDGEPTAPRSWLGLPAQPWVLRGGQVDGVALPARWLWVEVVTMAGFAQLAVQYGRSTAVIPLFVLAACLVTVSVIDLQLQRIPDRITFPTLALALPLMIAVSLQYDATDRLSGALVGMATYFVFLLVTHLVYPAGMGFGDVKLALVMGLFLGWLGWTDLQPVLGPVRLVLYALMLGCVLGVVFGVVHRVATKARGAFPFGPALAMGCFVVVLFAYDLSL